MKGGSRSVKEHKWFSGMDWEAVYKGQVGDKHVLNPISCLGIAQSSYFRDVTWCYCEIMIK